MCKVEGVRRESMQEGMEDIALRMLKSGKYTLEEAAAMFGLSLKAVKKFKTERPV